MSDLVSRLTAARATASRHLLLVPMLPHSPTPLAVALGLDPGHADIMRQLGWNTPLDSTTQRRIS